MRSPNLGGYCPDWFKDFAFPVMRMPNLMVLCCTRRCLLPRFCGRKDLEASCCCKYFSTIAIGRRFRMLFPRLKLNPVLQSSSPSEVCTTCSSTNDLQQVRRVLLPLHSHASNTAHMYTHSRRSPDDALSVTSRGSLIEILRLFAKASSRMDWQSGRTHTEHNA